MKEQKPRITLTRRVLYSLYEKRLIRELDQTVTPKHVAMIIDGNRRWAKQLGFTTAGHGHRAGAIKISEFLKWCDELGISIVTLYLLSGDNLVSRGTDELGELMSIISDLLGEISQEKTWRFHHVGSTRGLDDGLASMLSSVCHQTKNETGMHINLAIGYGGRTEITDAVRSIVHDHKARGGSLEELSEKLSPELISQHLYTSGQPDPDLVIRTSGEQRLSDFMLWQSAHSEFYFVEALGPDLRHIDFLRAIRDYSRRQRRYGS